MATTTRPSGVTATIAGDARIEPARVAKRKRGAKTTRTAPAARSSAGAALARALNEQDFEIADAVVVTRTPAPRKRGAAATAPATPELTLDVPLAKDERAVVLVEDEGEFRWITTPSSAPAADKRKRGARAPAKRTVRFEVALPASPGGSPRRAQRGRKRGVVGDWLVDKAVVYVLRFAVKVAGSKVVAHLERNVTEGLVSITAAELDRWKTLGDSAALPASLPSDRRPRVLLLVHGTFSSTIGSFGALCSTEQGRSFLTSALARYDVVLGYDHRTLSRDPRENAERMHERLSRVAWPKPPQIDVIAYSRGGLVARTWIEEVLPKAKSDVQIGSAIFVGATNGGTLLAEPENWNRFADHYTTLALAATRVASAIPGAQGWTAVASHAIRGVGALVKTLASEVVTKKLVPGLAAMEPDGDFVEAINAGHPGRDAAPYYAITSDFEPGEALSKGRANELPRRLLMRAVDGSADALYGESNDLVVHVRAMTQLAAAGGATIKTTLDYATNGDVYHLNYFAQAKTAEQLANWLVRDVRNMQQMQQQGASESELDLMTGPRERRRKKTGPKRAVRRARAPGSELEPLGARPRMAPTGSAKAAAPMPPRFPAPAMSRRPIGGGGGGRIPTGTRSRSPRGGGAGAAPRSAKPATESLTCFFRAEMPPEVALNQRATLRVDVSLEELLASAGTLSETKQGRIAARKKLTVEIAALRNLKAIGKHREQVAPPEPDTPRSVSFELEGTHLGDGEVSILVRQGSNPLVTLELEPRIVNRVTRNARPVEAKAESDQVGAPSEDLDELRIIEQQRGTAVTYLFLLDLPSLGIREEFESEVLEQGRDEYIKAVMNEIGDSWAPDGDGALEAFETDLRSIGGRMFDQLIPERMQKLLWQERNRIRAVQVISREPFIPWELVYLKDPEQRTIPDDSVFLGELGLLRWLQKGYPARELKVRRGRACYLVAEYEDPDLVLEQTAQEEAMVKRTLGATKLPAVLREVQEALRKPGSFDLLHYCGHGEAAGSESTQAKLLLTDEAELKATTVEQTARFDLERRPIVVLNACESARRNREFTGMGGFADAFVKAQVGLFIGTHWSVGDEPAYAFVEALYETFKKGKRIELVDAVRKARQKARETDATWIAYVVYGHPRATITFE